MGATFKVITTSALNKYKAILRKNLEPYESAEKIKQLRLKRRQLQNASDVSLYHVAQNVINDIKQEIEPKTDCPSWHFGISDFLQYLQSTLDEYSIENNKVVHSSQKASCALLETIQSISLPKDQINPNQLDNCIRIIARYGTSDQHSMLKNLLNKNIEANSTLSDALLRRFKAYRYTENSKYATS